MSTISNFVDVAFDGAIRQIEYIWVGSSSPAVPVLVFLHEGLGAVSLWKDIPEKLCKKIGARGLVFSRPGYGRSSPGIPGEFWGTDFMHKQAYEFLPAFLQQLQIDTRKSPLWFFGHSDGASISLLYAARFPECVRGLIVVAPHIMVEQVTITHIEKIKNLFESSDLKQKLGLHHIDPEITFRGWSDVWLSSDFLKWSIQSEIQTILAPILVLQGRQDECGTLAQMDGIKDAASQTECVVIEYCGHSPHRDHSVQLINAATIFYQKQADLLACVG